VKEAPLAVQGYKAIEEVSRTEWCLLQRGERVEGGPPVLLKTPPSHPPQNSDVELLKREFELFRRIACPGVPSVNELVRKEGSCALVLQDPGGISLAKHLNSQSLSLDSFFKLAIPLVATLAELHRQDLVCWSLSPQSILVNHVTGEVFLIDLALAVQESGLSQAHLPLHLFRSLLPYLSPEQTGRMNRTTDYRTDFYSLGVIFYEMLTGSRPFHSEDDLELIHAHIAKLPRPPAEVNRGVPMPLSDLVMKLLAKTAEERYQSALGIKEDLEQCQRQWSSVAWITSFPLGQRDISDRFLIPQKLYGRDEEVRKLLEAFDRACEASSSMMLVSGYSGIGKTSLIQELYKPIVSQRGYLISGKFDQVGRNVPFGALIQAFRGLVQQLLTESEERLMKTRSQLSEALGPNGGVLTEVLPELELVIGKQSAPPVLDPTAAQNRFQMVFQNFVAALSTQEHPLVIFLDDLQWADSATLSLLQPLLTSRDIQFLFLMGAYRDNEVDAAHPLARTLATLESAGARLHHVSLGPLTLSDLNRFVRDTLQGELSQTAPLARLVMEKTGGNPFFLIQFLKVLKQEGFLEFSYEKRCWTYQMEAIRGADITDNVVDLMTQKIRRLSPESQHALTLAACIGNPFDLETLAIVNQQSSTVAPENLREAVDEGLIMPLVSYDDFSGQQPRSPTIPSYAFLHDRVQQAAYALVPDQQKPLVHLTVGRLLLKRWDLTVVEEKVFDVVHHLNLGSSLITDDAECLAVAQLNLNAGRKAKASTAYQPALSYLQAGLALLSEKQWSSEYDLLFALHLDAAECKYLCGHFDEADQDFDLLLKRARTRMDKAQVYALRVLEYENQSRYAAALECGREGLGLFGVSFAASPDEKEVALESELSSIRELLGGRAIGDLISLPVMTDPEKRMVMRLLTIIWASAYISGDQILTRLISATMVRFSLEYGNTEESAYGYATHTVTIGPIKGDYASAYDWGQLALLVNERFNDQKGRAKIHQQFHAHANYWRRPLQTCVPHAREASRIGLETGDFAYAGYGAFTECWHTILVTPHLDQFVQDCSASLALLERVKMTGLIPAQKAIQNWARALQGSTDHPTSFSNAGFDETAFLETYGDHPFRVIYLHVLKVHLCVLFEEFGLAREAARCARMVAHHLLGTIWPVYLDFFEGLALTGVYRQADVAERALIETEVARLQRGLSVLAENCPENFRCLALLLTAELESIRDKTSEAMQSYEQAIQSAQESENLHIQALASELYARFWKQRGNLEVASLYLHKAQHCYSAWGATAKVKHLGETLIRLAGSPELPSTTAAAGVPASAHPYREQGLGVLLDVATVSKAARAIAVEIVLEELLRKLMRIALENAGAQRGCFLQEEKGRLVLAAEGDVDSTEVMVLPEIPREVGKSVSMAVVHYVQKTGEGVVVGNAVSDSRFSGDPYIRAACPKSILCVPVVNQGKSGGLLYLENNLAANAFTADRIEVMRILSSQAAISLENARLYSEMKQEAGRRQQAEETLRSIVEGTASVTGDDFFRSLVRHLASALQVRYAFVAACKDAKKARSLAYWKGEGFGENFEYEVAGTPCLKVLQGSTCYYRDHLQELFPEDRGLVELGARSYFGVPMLDASGRVIGHLVVLDDKPMAEDPRATSVLMIFAARAAAELERLGAEEGLRAALVEVGTLKNRLHAENIYLQEEILREHNFEEIVGGSPALLDLLRQVEQVAPTDSTVLIYGETGTGKELIARAIHNRSARKERPLVKVNCGAISAGLVESELFGHVKGAFTGAIEQRSGRFELADGGTLFLDEVSELPLETQVKLLRVLQEQEFEPVGSSRSVRVDVRIIAASNRDLTEAVSSGRFRSDLFYRLNVFPVTVPPLRSRRTDIPQLVTFFLSRFSRKVAKKIDVVSQETMDQLVNYSWPGNVRELQNVIERGVILSSGSVLRLDRNLVPDLGSSQGVTERAAVMIPDVGREAWTRGPSPSHSNDAPSLEEVERSHIMEILRRTTWIIEGPRGAARILNLHPNTLRSRMKKLGIKRSSHEIS
jgi:predicted ATPase/GAF domain-containing protein